MGGDEALSFNFVGLDLRFEPLTRWPEARTPAAERTGSAFRAGWASTLDLLKTELRHLDPVEIRLAMDLKLSQIRRDGMPVATARPESPAVLLVVVMDVDGERVEALFPADRFVTWQENMRAIALTLQALRAVERYGVTKKRQQYRGYKQIAALATVLPPEEAARVIAAMVDEDPDELLRDQALADAAGRRASKKAHPERGGDAVTFERVQRARDALTRHFRGEG